jgi:hypothetical protein|tara:strand:- start:471 stop:896 length:426 start_codon:yes stop_codon:yes gene_type:complete
MSKNLKQHATERLEELLGVAIWTPLVLWSGNLLMEWFQKGKNETESRLLILIYTVLLFLAIQYIAKVIKEKRSYLRFDKNLYWKANDPKPFCPICKDKEKENRRLMDIGIASKRQFYDCLSCHYRFIHSENGDYYCPEKKR